MRRASCRGGILAKVLGCLGVLIALGVAIIVVVWMMTDAPAKVARAFLDATGKGDTAKAYEQCSSEFKGKVSLGELTELVKLNPHIFNVKDSTFSDRHIESGGLCTLGGTVTAQDGTQSPVVFYLKEEDGGWKIVRLDSTSFIFRTYDALELIEIEQQKQVHKDQVVKFTISGKVVGFKTEQKGPAERVALKLGIETRDSTGKVFDDLTSEDVSAIDDLLGPGHRNEMDVHWNVSIPYTYGKGEYTATLKVHDLVGEVKLEKQVKLVVD